MNPENKADMKAERNTNPNVGANEERGFENSLFNFPKMAMPEVFRGLAEQSVGRAKENCERLKAASGEITDALSEAYLTGAKGAADYGIKVIELSSYSATSGFDFVANLLGTKSPSEIVKLSAVHARKNFDIASAQNKELWELAQKVAAETAAPINKSVAKILPKVT